jgi:hypothetical protein
MQKEYRIYNTPFEQLHVAAAGGATWATSQDARAAQQQLLQLS